MIFVNLPHLGAWTSAVHGMIFTGICVTVLACCLSLLIKTALVVTSVISNIKSRLSTAKNRR